MWCGGVERVRKTLISKSCPFCGKALARVFQQSQQEQISKIKEREKKERNCRQEIQQEEKRWTEDLSAV